MFILTNRNYSIFIGCYTTLENAQKAYEKMVSQKTEDKIPQCAIEEVPLDDMDDLDFIGGYAVMSTWEINRGGEWERVDTD
jgi:hypothetical protein